MAVMSSELRLDIGKFLKMHEKKKKNIARPRQKKLMD